MFQKHLRLAIVVKYSHYLFFPRRTIHGDQMRFLFFIMKTQWSISIFTSTHNSNYHKMICCLIPYVVLEGHSPKVLLSVGCVEKANEELSCVVFVSTTKKDNVT